MKVRLTNLEFGGGHLGIPFVQILGLGHAEMPKAENGLIIMKIKGLTPDGNLNPAADSFGYVALVRDGQDVETEMFRVYETLVREPSTRAIKKMLNIDPDNTPHL